MELSELFSFRKRSRSSERTRMGERKELAEAMAIVYYFQGDEGTSREEIIDRFSQYSQRYDKIMEAVYHISPTLTAQTTAELFPSNRKDMYILDVAAGTGLCAEKLYSHGFQKMDALEPSSRMLDEARRKGLYSRYFMEALGENALNIANDTYDAVTISALSSMVLIKLPIKAFEELIRIVKPGKYLPLSSNEITCVISQWRAPWILREFATKRRGSPFCLVQGQGRNVWVAYVIGGYVINTAFSRVLSDDGDDNAVFLRENMKTLEDHGKWKQIELRHFPQVGSGSDVAVSVHKVLT